MNNIILKGIIKDTQFSHKIGDVEYNKSNLIVDRGNGDQDIINLIYKKYSNTYKDNDYVELIGNVRSHTEHINGKNKVSIYVFTYFDKPTAEMKNNFVSLDANVCKVEPIYTYADGKSAVRFIVANNIKTNNGVISSYLPCVYYGNCKALDLHVGMHVTLLGKLISREYVNTAADEVRVAHEIVVDFVGEQVDEV